MIFLITQRLIETEYGDKQECLDVNWYTFISKIKNAQLIPISHCSKVFPDFLGPLIIMCCILLSFITLNALLFDSETKKSSFK